MAHLKSLLYRALFLYPKLYAFFCFYRKRARSREIEDKFIYFLKEEWNSAKRTEITKHIYELRGSRKAMHYLIPLMDDRFVKKHVRAEGLSHLDQALEKGRGALLMAPHLGNPHLAFTALRVMGYDITVLKGGGRARELNPLELRYYDRPDNTIFVHDPTFSSDEKKGKILEVFQAGKIMYYSADASEGRIKEDVLFFGKKIGFPTGMLHLARQAQAAIIPIIHLYHGGEISVILKEPIDREWAAGEKEYGRILAEFAQLLEPYIRAYPEQYFGIYGPTVLDDYYRSHRTAAS